jgi:hypothetical protein
MQPMPSRSSTAVRPPSIQRSNIECFGWWMRHGVPRRSGMTAASAVCSAE